MTQSIQRKIAENKRRFLKELKDELEQENKAKEPSAGEVEKSASTEDGDCGY